MLPGKDGPEKICCKCKRNPFTLQFKVLLMKEKHDYLQDISEMRAMMERSSKFLSLTGWSGILAGIYALIGARFAARILTNHVEIGSPPENEKIILPALIVLALIVLILALLTSLWLTSRKARRRNETVWNPVSRRMLSAISVPFLTGAFFVGVAILNEDYTLIAPACLIFYGLGLTAGSHFTLPEVKWLGLGEILLGLLALAMPKAGLLLWTIGFSLLHILYGILMHFKYER